MNYLFKIKAVMKRIFITEGQKNNLKYRYLLTEDKASKAIKNYIKQHTASFVKNMTSTNQDGNMDMELGRLPNNLVMMINPGFMSLGQNVLYSKMMQRNYVAAYDDQYLTSLFIAVRDNQNGCNRFIDFLRLNFTSQFSISFSNGPKKYAIGIARISLGELGFYSFSPSVMRGGDIVQLAKMMKIISSEPELLEHEGITLDENLNGLDYNGLKSLIGPCIRHFKHEEREKNRNGNGMFNSEYRIVEIKDRITSCQGTPMFKPTQESAAYLNSLRNYTDWCICGSSGEMEYGQYTSNGGKFYICEKIGFQNVPKQVGENCPLDEYGLSLIAVLVGYDGIPDSITTRWNHDNGGENHKDLWKASQLQSLLNIDFDTAFRPRSREELVSAHIAADNDINEAKVKTAQEQVHGKVNSGIMNSVAAVESMCESKKENEENDSTDFDIYFEKIGEFMAKSGLNVKPFPKINLDWTEQDGLFINTGYYNPEEKSITIFCKDRHPKDILRTFSHEMIHHSQNLDGKDLNFKGDKVKDDKKLEKIEAEAYLKGNIYFRKWTEHMKSKKNINESKCSSLFFESIKPNDVDLSSFDIQKNLNPKFWKNGLLDSRIRMKLMDVADDFIDFLGVDWVKPKDIIITGSLANYNWNKKYSDIDLHVLIDFSKVDKRKDFVKKYFDSLKTQWNELHEKLSIFGFPVEVYVQDINEKHTATGVYSIDKNKWIKEPERDTLTSCDINKKLIKSKVSSYINKIDNLEKKFKSEKDIHKLENLKKKADELFNDIKNERKSSLNKENGKEMSNGNIIFKCLRRMKYIDKLCDLRNKFYDKINSL